MGCKTYVERKYVTTYFETKDKKEVKGKIVFQGSYIVKDYNSKWRYSDELKIHVIISRTITENIHKEVQLKIMKEIEY